MNNQMKPEQALQLLSSALEPQNISQISRSGYITIQTAIEVLAAAIKQTEPSEDHATND
ncbi:MAG: hypothetical protein WAN16_03165 [Chthoniobacterales bacterium]